MNTSRLTRLVACSVVTLFAPPTSISHAACIAPPSGLVSWWSGDDTGYDLAGFNHGALKNGASYTDGKVGRAFNFDGVDDHIQTTTWGMNLGTLNFTIVGWVKTTSTKVRSTIVEFEFHAPALYVAGPDGVLQLSQVASPIGGFNDGQFHHFAVARDNGVLSFYKDGALIGTTNFTGDLNRNVFYIGYNTLSGDAFPGVIDELAFFNRALSGSEIAAIVTDGMCKPALPALPYFIEAEDFDFNGGQRKIEADSMPYLGGAYAGLSATAEIDYHDPGSNENADYRPASQTVALFGNNDTHRDSYLLTSNYKIGWNDPGDWFNYTRVFPSPAQSYHIYARLSSGAAANAIQLDEVVSGAGTVNQTLSRIGQAIGPASGGWDAFIFVPVTDASGNPVTVNYGGQKTLRITVLAGGNEDINYLQFVPVQAPSPGPCVASASSLVAWWSGDNHPRDLQGSSHGTLKNGATYATGKVGEGFVFDGVNDYVETALDVQPSAMPSTTWECWVFPTGVPGFHSTILSCDDGGFDRALLIQGGSFGVFVGFGVWQPIGFTPNQWQHVAVVYTPNNVEFYKNGVRFSFNATPTGGGTANKLQIGRNPGFGEYFQGRIDEVCIYNRTLSERKFKRSTLSAARAGANQLSALQ